ncbi:hypothetical protein WAF17_02495 [Bernardetia sp. ABR2-2B]|uniref:hypothetical protein n=1 Tax=Bernardetia sp. ABR2-2B TaxID=3127472 RepID=UPI0030D148E4
MASSTTINKTYSDKEVDILLRIIQQSNRDYDVEIDGTTVISRTDDTNRYYDLVDFILPTTKFVTIRIFKGASRNYDRTVLIMLQNGLNGTPQIEALNAYDAKPKVDTNKLKAEWEKDRLIEDLKKEKVALEAENKRIKQETKEQIREIETDAKQQIQDIKDRQNSLSGMIETVAPALAQTLSTSKLAQSYPMLGALGTVDRQEQTPPIQNNEAGSSEVKFKPKNTNPNDDKLLGLVQDLKDNFEIIELETIFNFLHHASQDKSLLLELETLTPNENADL